MALTIIIDGLSEEELHAVGPKDIITLLNRNMFVRPADVQAVQFVRLDEDDPSTVWVHPDNYVRPDK